MKSKIVLYAMLLTAVLTGCKRGFNTESATLHETASDKLVQAGDANATYVPNALLIKFEKNIPAHG